jgi:Sec-independent protein translocase protein TatA
LNVKHTTNVKKEKNGRESFLLVSVLIVLVVLGLPEKHPTVVRVSSHNIQKAHTVAKKMQSNGKF